VSDDADDPWRVVSDGVLQGLNHELSNRVASIAALTAVITPDEAPGREVAELLAGEAGRLEAALRLYRLLPAGRPRPAEPLLVADALADARALHAYHSGLADAQCAVEGDADALPPVIVPLPGLVHALTLLLGALALHGRAAAAGPGPVLRLAGDARAVRLVGESGGAPGTVPPLAPRAVAAAVARLLRGAGTAAGASSSDGVRYTVELPTLVPRQ
jgi:hypothetical protein